MTKANSEKQDFKRYLQEIENPRYDGPDISQALPANASPIDKAKYQICEKILAYQQDSNLPIEEVARKIQLTTAETKDIFHYHLSLFTLERLITYANRLLSPREVEITKELILNIFRAEVNAKRFFPTDYQGIRKVFVREGVPFGDEKYKLVFWFKDGTNDHL
ncbi:12551_t:CDS:2 [Racocetra persica]|uniref:12548_t:CDS:1 n=2 Tax=Racocetra persica TaxID=160502 RepID=A0ACA9M3M8_9GLOM|nr:12548_t:CDS:2 [Racocetra persica]CAG8567508.1 12551_t:CDS:2 [Racocetra persica]